MSSVFPNCNSWPSDVTAPNGLSHSAGTRTNTSTDDAVEPQTWTGDRYEIREELGRGGGGIVLQAWDKLLEREVVIKKILDPKSITARARFQREAKITASLVHPGIVPVHELGIDPSSGCPYYAMQRIAGQTLDRVLVAKHTQHEGLVKSIDKGLLRSLVQICRTVGYAHSQQIIHRDLKPSNLCVGQHGEVFVLDWGIAKRLADKSGISDCEDESLNGQPSLESSTSDLTRVGDTLGTVSYMSPEQAAKRTEAIDQRSDVFALGIILYELLTGVHPFRCPTSEETREHIIRCEYLPVRLRHRGIPCQLAAICNQALSADPILRYANATEMADDIERFLLQEKVVAYKERWYESVDRFANRHRPWFWATLITSTFLTCASIVTSAIIHQSREVEREARLFAEEEHRAKTEALACEQVAHKEAITQLQSARDSIDTWIVGLDHDLANYPGLNEMRQSLLDRAEMHYQQLTSKLTDSPLMNLEVARAQIRLGDVLGMRRRYDDSQACYERAQWLLTKDCFSDRSDWYSIQLSQLALAQTGLAKIYLDKHGDLDSADKMVSQAIETLGDIDPLDPEFGSSRRTLALAYLIRANGQALRKEHDAAEQSFRQALGTLQSESTSNPFFHDLRTEAEVQRALADWLHVRGEYSEAKEAYYSLVRCFDQLLDQGRNRPDWLESRASAKLAYASCLKQLLNPTEAVAVYESAEEDLRRAWEIFSSESTHREEESNIYNGLGISLLLLGDSKQAEHVFQLSLEALNGTNIPANSESIKRKLHARIWIAVSQLDQFQSIPEAELIEMDGLLKHPSMASLQDSEYQDLLYQWRWLKSTIDLRADRLPIAEQELSQWVTEFDEQAARNENSPGTLGDVSLRYVFVGKLLQNMALIQSKSNRRKDAAESIEKARNVWQRARESSGQVAAIAGFCLIQSWCEESNINGDRSEAIALAKELVREHPASPTAWYWMAETELRFGQKEDALFAMRKVNRLRRQLRIDDELLDMLINEGQINSERMRTEIYSRFGIHEIPLGTHARFLVENK